MHLAKSILVLGLTAGASAGCGGGGGDALGFVDVSGLDPGVETYTGDSSDYIFENGYVLRINRSAAPVHGGLVSVQFQDVEQQEIRFPSHSHPDKIRIAQGGTYVFHAWFHGIDVGGGATVDDVPIDFLAAFYIGEVGIAVSPTTTTHFSAFGAWEMLSFSFEVPFGIDRCYISMRATAAPAFDVDLYLDDFSLERVD